MRGDKVRSRWTYAEFARLPSAGSTRHEIIDHELAVTPAPTSRHQEIVTNLVTVLSEAVRARGLGKVLVGPVDVLLAEGDYLEPDVVFVREERLHILSDRGIEGPPDLVAEVVSPSTAERDRGVKLDRYRLHGVPEYWIVDPETRTVEAWALGSDASRPERLGETDTLEWSPTGADQALAVRLEDVFAT